MLERHSFCFVSAAWETNILFWFAAVTKSLANDFLVVQPDDLLRDVTNDNTSIAGIVSGILIQGDFHLHVSTAADCDLCNM